VSGLAISKARGSEVVDEAVVRQKSGGTCGRRVDVARGTTEETRGISAERRGPAGKLVSLLLWSGRDPVDPEYFLIW
jgi:hypothetical protein